MPVYVWNKGFRPTIDATVFAQRYEHLRAQHLEVTADVIVQDARQKTSPIHSAFEWNNKQAAHEHRLHQARTMMTALRIIDEGLAPDVRQPTRFLISVKSVQQSDAVPSLRTYVPLREALQDAQQRQQVLIRAIGELRAFQEKYREIQELSQVFNAIEESLSHALIASG
jgi:hypothetical protein